MTLVLEISIGLLLLLIVVGLVAVWIEVRRMNQGGAWDKQLKAHRDELISAFTSALDLQGRRALDQNQQVTNEVQALHGEIISALSSSAEQQHILALDHSERLTDLGRTLAPVHFAFRPRTLAAPWISAPFSSALALAPLLDASATIGQDRLFRELAQYWPDAAVAVGNIASVVQRKGKLIATFSEEGQALLNAKELILDAKGLPMLKDSAGKVRHIARVAEEGGQMAAKAASLGTAVVSVAHIISGADNAKKLKAIGRGVDILVQARKNDQVAELESIYVHCQRILSNPVDKFDLQELCRAKRELHSVRTQIRQDFKYRLEQVEDPGVLDNFCRNIGITSVGDSKMEKQILSAHEQLAMYRFAFVFQLTLEETLGTFDNYLKLDAPGEVNALREVDDLFQRKLSKLSPNSSNNDVVQMRDEFSQTLSLISSYVASPAVEVAAQEITTETLTNGS